MDTKPRVMIVIDTDIIGGPGKGIFQFLEYADSNLFDYILCNYRSHKPSLRDDFFREAERRGIQLYWLHQHMLLDPTLVAQARRLIQLEKINLIQTHSYKSNILGCLLKLLYKITWIAFAHGYTRENIKMAVYNRMDLACYRFADKAVVVSDPLRKLLIKHCVKPDRIIKIPNAVSVDELSPQQNPALMRQSLGIEEGDKVIGIIGRLSLEKGHIVFLKAFRKVTAQLRGVKALIIGDGPEHSRLLAYCRSYDMEAKVRFTGQVTNMDDYYQILDLVVIPSFSEGLPNVLLEAMAFGVPVVATRVGAIEDVLQELPYNLIQSGDEETLASKIQQFLNDPMLCQDTSQRGKAIITARFNPSERADKLIAVYHQVLAARQ